MNHFSRVSIATIFIAFSAVARLGKAQELLGLGDLPGGSVWSDALDVSADGSTVVGWSHSEFGWQAFRWTEETGMVGLGDLPGGGFLSIAYSVSDDGSVVVGHGRVPGEVFVNEAFRWTDATGLVGLGFLPSESPCSQAFAVSGDGLVVGGRSQVDSLGQRIAFRWTAQEGMHALGVLPGGLPARAAWNLSENGSVVVGHAMDSQGTPEAFVWTEQGGLFGPGVLPGGWSSSFEFVSPDGSIAFGWGTSSEGYQVLQWTPAGGLEGLGVVDAHIHDGAMIHDGIADQPILVGENQAVSDWRAIIWDKEHGARLLEDVLTNEYRFDLGGWVLREAWGISADGLTIVGKGSNPDFIPEAWILHLPICSVPGDADCDGDVDLRDFAALLQCISGPNVPYAEDCDAFDLDADRDVDWEDFGLLQIAFTVP